MTEYETRRLAKASGMAHWSDIGLIKFAEAYAAKALEEKEREIADLKAGYLRTQESTGRISISYLELQAHINDLREGIAEIAADAQDSYTNEALTKLLSKTPAKVLEEKGELVRKQEREIAELLFDIDSYIKTNKELTEENIRYLEKNNELQAHINDLREALEYYVQLYALSPLLETARLALSKTPAQSQIEHDNALIEKCAKVCESLENEDTGYVWIPDARAALHTIAKAIRALKGKQNGT